MTVKSRNITIGNDITFSYVSNNLEVLYGIKEDVDFEFKKVFSKPGGISFLSTLINYANSLDYSIDIIHDDDIMYLQRANFFKNLGYEIEESFTRHSVSRNMMEAKEIFKDGDPDFIDDRLKIILKSHIKNKENLILGILLTTYEVTDNILEHSNGGEFIESERSIDMPGFICAQYYGGSQNQIEIGISDSGIGIVNSLKNEYPDLSRKDVLKKAFELNTSRHKQIMPSRGNGLAKLKEFVLSSEGSIVCRTNEFKITFNKSYPHGRIKLENEIIGTHFEIIICCKKDIDTKPIFNAIHEDYEDESLDDFFDF
ncbi:hypothetical protein [Sulfurimonas sp.]|uniref:hypothetical protein n=1 Tax=Sulfurimonas sp. TaxID=2022749 RepID=UPI0025D1AF4F|nr:hypothetical protein [Sulfurimonas sp.]